MNPDDRLLEDAVAFARAQMGDLAPSHGWDHVERVERLAARIAGREGADLFTVRLAAFLHDIARVIEDSSGGKICHAEAGSAMAFDFLRGKGMDEEGARHVADCILTHRFRNEHAPATIEARCLYDADKLDSIGAIGIGRAFLFAGEVNAKLHNPDVDVLATSAYSGEDTAYREYMVKLRHVRERMQTREGARIAAKRHDFMVGFFERLTAEARGGS
jgi:uncharacterized protein